MGTITRLLLMLLPVVVTATGIQANEVAPAGAGQPPPTIDLGLKPGLEPAAMAIIKAASDKLTAAKTLSFDAVTVYESPARTGQPLAYMTLSHVTLQRPDRLRVLTPADGPPQEFYYNGKQIMAFSPKDDMVAIADAPPTVEGALKLAYQEAAIYFPFTDLVVGNPYKDIADGLKLAFVVGQSKVVGGVTTDIVALGNDTVQGQVWIGAEDKLPRLFRATYFNEPGNFRHEVVFSNWHLDEPVPADAFWSAQGEKAKRIPLRAPDEAPDAGKSQGGKNP